MLQVLLILASEHRSIRLSLAALQMLSTAGQHQRSVSGQRASAAVLPALLPASQDLVMTMVQHPAPQVRAAACRGLQQLINSLDPGVLDIQAPSPAWWRAPSVGGQDTTEGAHGVEILLYTKNGVNNVLYTYAVSIYCVSIVYILPDRLQRTMQIFAMARFTRCSVDNVCCPVVVESIRHHHGGSTFTSCSASSPMIGR